MSTTWSSFRQWREQRRTTTSTVTTGDDNNNNKDRQSEGNNGVAVERLQEESSPAVDDPYSETERIPGIVSIAVRQSTSPITGHTGMSRPRFAWKLDLIQDEKSKDVVVRGVENESSLWSVMPVSSSSSSSTGQDATASSLQGPSPEQEEQVLSLLLLQPGDVLESVNACACRDLTVSHIQNLLDHSGGGGGLLTVLAKRPKGDGSLIQATALVYQQQIIQSPSRTGDAKDSGKESDEENGNDTLDDANADDGNNISQDMTETGLSFEQSSEKSRYVRIAKRGSFGCLGQSALEIGDEVLSVNGMDCMDCAPEDLEILLCSKLGTPSGSSRPNNHGDDEEPEPPLVVTLLAHRRSTKWTVRKAAVAVAGGSMVSVGAVIMATPLHPIGHAMAIGGVGVLSTEFEGPRRVMNSATQRIRKSFAKSSSTTTNETTTETEDTTENDHERNSTRPSKQGEDSFSAVNKETSESLPEQIATTAQDKQSRNDMDNAERHASCVQASPTEQIAPMASDKQSEDDVEQLASSVQGEISTVVDEQTKSFQAHEQ